MSGWTVVTLRPLIDAEYEHSEYNEQGRYDSINDLCATVEEDERISSWKCDTNRVYAYLNCDRYGWNFAEELIENYSHLVQDAVVLGANDTTDTGTAKYYEVGEGYTDEYEETQGEDGYHVGYMALQKIGARNDIIACDPFHTWLGKFEEERVRDGDSRLND